MNIQKFAATYGLDVEEAVDILRLFIKTAETDLNAVQRALDQEDIDNICHAAHSLKGAAGNLGFTEMSETAVALEQDAGNQLFSEVRAGLYVLSLQLADIKAQLNEVG